MTVPLIASAIALGAIIALEIVWRRECRARRDRRDKP